MQPSWRALQLGARMDVPRTSGNHLVMAHSLVVLARADPQGFAWVNTDDCRHGDVMADAKTRRASNELSPIVGGSYGDFEALLGQPIAFN
jgi:hypothetical protein